MTLMDVTKQIMMLTNGRINGEKLTRKQFRDILHTHFTRCAPYKYFIFSGVFPDGEWLIRVTHLNKNEYDYQIAETKKQFDNFVQSFGTLIK